jgi:prepilin-type N-terminal cleavage/methylation domain-containing protein
MIHRIRKAMEEREEGFTLIELLVVIIIIGILAAIAIPIFLNQRQKGYEASMKSDLRTVANEMETSYTDTQTYPGVWPATSGTVTVGSDTVTLSNGNSIANVAAGAVAGSDYCLVATSTKTSATYSYDSNKGGLLPKGTACS